MLTSQNQQENSQKQTQPIEQDVSAYHPMASVAELLVMLRNENKNNKLKSQKQQYTYMEFVDKETGEVLTQRVLF